MLIWDFELFYFNIVNIINKSLIQNCSFPWKVGVYFVQAIPLPQKWGDVYPPPPIHQDLRQWYICYLKEKLPQAFMQIRWMEDDFRNLTAKVWANLDNPIKRYDFSKVSLILCMSPSQVALF